MFDTGSWLIGYTVGYLVLLAFLALWSFYLVLGGGPLFSEAVLED